jgi:plasmid maintenance system antidote protein VapI
MNTRRPTHPGEVHYEDVIKVIKYIYNRSCNNLGVSRKTLSELINGKE